MIDATCLIGVSLVVIASLPVRAAIPSAVSPVSKNLRTAIPQSAPEETMILAKGVERRLDEISRQLQRYNSKFGAETLAIFVSAATIDQYAEGSKVAADLKREVMHALDEYPKTTAPLVFEMTILALRLQQYRETGKLPPDVPNREQVKRFIENSWSVRASLPTLALDIPTLKRQLRRYDELIHPRFSAERIEPSSINRREYPMVSSPEFVRDAGRGKIVINPIPKLIGLLAAVEPLKRALAADELGKHGVAAATAIPALRSALLDPDARVRASAALALSSIPNLTSDVIKEIRGMLNDKNEDVRFSAQTALQRLEKAR